MDIETICERYGNAVGDVVEDTELTEVEKRGRIEELLQRLRAEFGEGGPVGKLADKITILKTAHAEGGNMDTNTVDGCVEYIEKAISDGRVVSKATIDHVVAMIGEEIRKDGESPAQARVRARRSDPVASGLHKLRQSAPDGPDELAGDLVVKAVPLPGSDVVSEIDKIAERISVDFDCSIERARVEAWKQRPDLYAKYQRQRRTALRS